MKCHLWCLHQILMVPWMECHLCHLCPLQWEEICLQWWAAKEVKKRGQYFVWRNVGCKNLRGWFLLVVEIQGAKLLTWTKILHAFVSNILILGCDGMYENVKRSLNIQKITPMLQEVDNCMKRSMPMGRSADCQVALRSNYMSCQDEVKKQVAEFVSFARSMKSNFNL